MNFTQYLDAHPAVGLIGGILIFMAICIIPAFDWKKKPTPSSALQTFRPSGNSTKKRAGIGMPQTLWLHEFGDLVSAAFDGEVAYHVGSSLDKAVWRDVDVRIMLDDDVYEKMGFGDPRYPHDNRKWAAYTMAFSELGKRMTGLPIDFQIQQTTWANTTYRGDREKGEWHSRSALMLASWRKQEEFKKLKEMSMTQPKAEHK